ncbi:ArnT family glycosyltransferase [Pedobacter jejuensis]|uniref:ArnT family glycosyltransferase n=1 Tax=Pedobacter jejuensis TaxID=1268550 RepID=UPI00142DFD33|nr:glycosyltransferase family 39 protein [Pedobacter jejuensis]
MIVLLLVLITLRILVIFLNIADIAGMEQNVIYSIQQLLYNGNLYTSPLNAPFSITQYTPIYYLINAFTAKSLGFTEDNIYALYHIGRFWNLIFNLASSYLIYRIGKDYFRISGSKTLILFVASFALNFAHNFAVRPDSLHDLAGIASIYAMIVYYQSGKKNIANLLLTVALTAIAVFSKQSGIQFIIIFVGFTFLIKDWATMLKLIASTVLFYGILFYTAHLIYPSFFENIIGGVKNGIDVTNFVEYILTRSIFILTGWPLILYFLYLLLSRNLLFKGADISKLLAISGLGTLIFASVTALKMGATTQYYVVFMNLALIVALNQSFKIKASVKGLKFFIDKYSLTSFFCLFIILIFGFNTFKSIANFKEDPKLISQKTSTAKIAKLISSDFKSNNDKYVYSNLGTDTYAPSRQFLNNIYFKNCLVPQRDILEYSTSKLEVVGYNEFEKLLKDGDIEYIIDSNPNSKYEIVKDFNKIKNSDYTLVLNSDGYLVYKNNKSTWKRK